MIKKEKNARPFTSDDTEDIVLDQIISLFATIDTDGRIYGHDTCIYGNKEDCYNDLKNVLQNFLIKPFEIFKKELEDMRVILPKGKRTNEGYAISIYNQAIRDMLIAINHLKQEYNTD